MEWNKLLLWLLLIYMYCGEAWNNQTVAVLKPIKFGIFGVLKNFRLFSFFFMYFSYFSSGTLSKSIIINYVEELSITYTF